MDFKDQLKQLTGRIEKLKDQIQTEEATKNAFIMPFIVALGYDVFNPLEVIPEFICDIGIKKGEKIDYVICKDGSPMILIECKHWGHELNVHEGQLLRYYHVSKARFGILTNGVIYRFYTDLKAPNKMDDSPFFEFNLLDIRENQIDELKKFHKSYFDVDNILSTASELQYTNQLKALVRNELSNPSEQLVRFLASQVYSGKMMAKVVEQFTELVRRSISSVVSDMIHERLNNAIKIEKKPDSTAGQIETVITEDVRDPTLEEMEAFYIVKAILTQKIPPKRVYHRDSKSYFSIILDDNNRKPICRLYLEVQKKVLVTFGEGKSEHKHILDSIDDIFLFSQDLLDTIEMY